MGRCAWNVRCRSVTVDKIIKKIRLLVAVLVVGVVFAVAGLCVTGQRFVIDGDTIGKVVRMYGEQARDRLLEWQDLINRDKSGSDREKLDKVNAFFNRMAFVSDSDHWGKEDYWATPIEFIASQGGDCEDFSLAKYFTLKAIGVPENKLNLTYVKALRLNQHHMVLTYYSEPGAEPLVLDNLTDRMLPASQRTDLLPIYSFNGTALWLAKQRGRGQMVGSSSRLQRWQDLLQRMPAGMQ